MDAIPTVAKQEEVDFADKLKGYREISASTLKVGDHFRYTCNKFNEAGRKVTYAVVKSVSQDRLYLWVNSYQPKFADWRLDLNNPSKLFRFYSKK